MKIYPINLTQLQLNYIGDMLGRCPYNEVRDLVASLQAQIAELEKPPAPPAPPAE